MKLYLNAGFGELLPQEDLKLIEDLGFHGIRNGLTPGSSDEKVRSIVQQFSGTSLRPIFMLPETWAADYTHMMEVVAREIKALQLPRTAIELGNEPEGKTPAWAFGQAVRNGHDLIKSINQDIKVISGGIKDFGTDQLNFLEDAMEEGWPDDLTVGFHAYRTLQPPSKPLGGYNSRAEEFEALRSIAGTRPIWNTEVGWHTAPNCSFSLTNWSCGFLKRKWNFSETQVADFVEQEAYIEEQFGTGAMTIYQLNDGPQNGNYENYFGLRRLDGSLKPLARRIKTIAQAVA